MFSTGTGDVQILCAVSQHKTAHQIVAPGHCAHIIYARTQNARQPGFREPADQLIPRNFWASIWTQSKLTIPFHITPSPKESCCHCYSPQDKRTAKMPSMQAANHGTGAKSGLCTSLKFLEEQTQFCQGQFSLYPKSQWVCGERSGGKRQLDTFPFSFLPNSYCAQPFTSSEWEKGVTSSRFGKTFQLFQTGCNIP